MKKILLAILIITLGLKVIGENSAFAAKYSIINLATEDDEGKKEKEKNKHVKRYNEDLCCNNVELNLSAQLTVVVTYSLIPQKPDFGCTDKPGKPPPDLINFLIAV